MKMLKKFGLSMLMTIMLVMAVPVMASAAEGGTSGTTVDGLTGGGVKSDIPLIEKGTNLISQLLQFAFFAFAAWYSLRFLKDKAYGQFFGFLFFVILIYIIIFNPTALGNLATSISKLFS